MERLIKALDIRKIEYKTDVSTASLSSFKIGGNCSLVVFPKSKDELAASIREARESGVKYEVVGKGSNVLFSDDGYDGMLILTSHMNQITEENGYIYAETGAHLGALSGYAAARSLSGLEFAYGIPGSLGGAVFMNAGAYGGEMKDVVIYSDYYDPKTDSFGRFSGEEQRFSYRKSVYSENNDLVILGAAIKLSKGNESEIRELMNENMQKRPRNSSGIRRFCHVYDQRIIGRASFGGIDPQSGIGIQGVRPQSVYRFRRKYYRSTRTQDLPRARKGELGIRGARIADYSVFGCFSFLFFHCLNPYAVLSKEVRSPHE